MAKDLAGRAVEGIDVIGAQQGIDNDCDDKANIDAWYEGELFARVCLCLLRGQHKVREDSLHYATNGCNEDYVKNIYANKSGHRNQNKCVA